MGTEAEGPLGGKVAVITGASRGIGKRTALALAGRGAKLVITARTEQERKGTPGTIWETAGLIRETGHDPVVIPADLSLQEDLDRVVRLTLEHFGGVDILINNAAYTVGKALWAHIPELTREQWDKGFAINVTAPLMLISAFWNSMLERGGGLVINITSGAANMQPLDEATRLSGSDFPANGPLYGATKAALNRMANVIAQEGAEHGIAVVNLEPGHVLTETMHETYTSQGVDAADTGAIPTEVPAAAIAYLCAHPDRMQLSGSIVSAPQLVSSLGLHA
jgi:NAD(P)-dependent dehydrogenase (short-subunit alcohol dehydrogenase family)